MPKQITQEEAYKQCSVDGNFLPLSTVDKAKVGSMIKLVEEEVLAIQDLRKTDRWNTVYKLAYDAIHTLAEAFLLLDSVKSYNHQCLFAFLCIKHPELELSWDFFEKIRTKRNGIQYYGSSVNKEDWKEVEVQIFLYINLLRKAIKAKMKKF